MERWADIDGTGGAYQVSTAGRVRRPRDMCRGSFPAGRLVVCRLNTCGYPIFSTVIAGKRFTRTVHRMVMEAFVGIRPFGLECAHLNGDSTDPRLENLAYVTPSENARHKLLHGTASRGVGNANAKLSDADVMAIKVRLGLGETATAVAADYPVKRACINSIRLGRRWGHIEPRVVRESNRASVAP